MLINSKLIEKYFYIQLINNVIYLEENTIHWFQLVTCENAPFYVFYIIVQ